MRNRFRPASLRLVLIFLVPIAMTFGAIGCGGSDSPKTGTTGDLPPEAKQANKSMEDFMKTKKTP